jgi:GWxTD domain-containing protein
MLKQTVLIVLLASLVFACKSKEKSGTNLATIYNENDNYFIRDYRLYNGNDSVSEINIIVNQNKLLFVKLAGTKLFSAHYEISYIVYSDFDKAVVLDSTTFEFSVNKNDAVSTKMHNIKVVAPAEKNYFVEIIARDLQRNSNFSFLTELTKKSKLDRHYFLIQQKEKAIGNSFSVDTGEVCIENHLLLNDTLIVRCYYRNFQTPLEPFDLGSPSVFNRTADSIYTVITDNTGNFNLHIQQHGFYVIQKDSAAENSLCLMHFNSEYPFIVHQEQMLNALEYLCDKKEFEKLKESSNVKEAINTFWLENCGNEDNAKEHIKQFYLRTEVANKFFSSYREGWCTDRGMIFIIFGPPRYIFRSETSERWVYGDDNSVMSEDFLFRKINNPYSSNAYALERSSTYKNTWYKMIEAWRDGRLF